MIILAAALPENRASPTLIDFGGIITPAKGGEDLNLRRNGNRFSVAFSIATGTSENRRVLISDILAAKSEGLRLPFPLEGVDQSGGGSLVVDGAGQTGNTLALRGGTPDFVIRKGWWLSIQRADGRHYLHNVRNADFTIDEDGNVLIGVSPNLRYPFADGAVVHLAQPMIEGLIVGEIGWNLQLAHMVDGIGFTLREVA